MTEATATVPRLLLMRKTASSPVDFSVSILPLSAGLAVLKDISNRGQSGFSCAPHWVSHWASFVNNQIVMITGSHDGELVAAVALEIVLKSGLRIAQFVGGSHANANFPMLLRQLSDAEAAAFIAQIKSGLSAAPWTVDAIILERQLEMLAGLTNPLVTKNASISPNVSLHLNVDQNFEAVLETRSGKRKRKRHRSQQRKFELAGGFIITTAVPKAQSVNLLDKYFAMKAAQLSGKGVANVFGDVGEQAFFKALFSDETKHDDHAFFLSSLEVGGKIRAIYGSSLQGSSSLISPPPGGRQIVHFTAFANDELTTASPGDFLNFALVEAACNSGIKTYDLGVGDEAYKRSWCDIETWHRDTVIGLSLRGKMATLQFEAITVAKRWLKNNQKLWKLAKRMRQFKSAPSATSAQSNANDDGSEL